MELVSQQVTVWGQCPTNQEDTFERIEKAARTCYQSLDKMKEDTSVPFLKRLLSQKPAHLSVTEHSSMVYRTGKAKNPVELLEQIRGHINSDFIYSDIHEERIYIFGNYRAFYEMELQKDADFDFFSMPGDTLSCEGLSLRLVTNQEEIPRFAKAVTICFKTSRDVTHEIVRHRPAAYSQESQRYVKYDGGMEFIFPAWWGEFDIHQANLPLTHRTFLQSIKNAEADYKIMREEGLKAQDARVVLPNATATTIVMTAFLPEWDHVFSLRCTANAYPAIRHIMVHAQSSIKLMA